jgi:hypothetical protein
MVWGLEFAPAFGWKTGEGASASLHTRWRLQFLKEVLTVTKQLGHE